MTEQTNENPALSTGQVTFLFLIFVSMLLAIFTVGVYIGRWSQPTVDRKAESLRTANISFVEANLTVNAGANPNGVAHQALPGAPLSMRVDESKTTPGYAIQVATLPTIEEANGLVTQLKRDGLTRSYVRSPEPGSVAQLFSVEIAPFDDKASADQAVTQLKSKGLNRSRVIQVFTDKKTNKAVDQSTTEPPTAP